jgi:anti-sigma factor (TIGR02949 family)
MTPSFTNWITETFLTTAERKLPASDAQPNHCDGQQAVCFEHLIDLLDGRMSEDGEEQMRQNIDACRACYQEFDVLYSIRQALKYKVEEQTVPKGLLEDIRAKIVTMA